MTTDIKVFTPLEARKTLPLVKSIIRDILNTSREIRFLAEENEGNIEDHPRTLKLVEQIDEYISELEDVGCFYKDWNFTIGLVDFPSVIDGEDVMLCWRSDEEDIKYYHSYESGYSGRKLIPQKYFEE